MSDEQPDGFGLDKDARNAAERAKDAKDAVSPPLDPDFPYRAEAFPIGFLLEDL